MATIYVDSAGSDTSPYDTWGKAAVLLQTALTAWTTGDIILVKENSTVTPTSGTALTGGAEDTLIPIYSADASDVYGISVIGTPK